MRLFQRSQMKNHLRTRHFARPSFSRPFQLLRACAYIQLAHRLSVAHILLCSWQYRSTNLVCDAMLQASQTRYVLQVLKYQYPLGMSRWFFWVTCAARYCVIASDSSPDRQQVYRSPHCHQIVFLRIRTVRWLWTYSPNWHKPELRTDKA